MTVSDHMLTEEEIRYVSTIIAREHRAVGGRVEDVTDLLYLLQKRLKMDLSSLKPDPTKRYIIEEVNTVPSMRVEVKDRWTDTIVLTVKTGSFMSLEDARELTEPLVEAMNNNE